MTVGQDAEPTDEGNPTSVSVATTASTLPRRLVELDTPAPVVELPRLNANLARAATIADAAGLSLRPHTKTHKSVAIARRQLAAGAAGLTVSKLDELAALRAADAPSYLLAYPVVTRAKATRLVDLLQSIPADLQVGVDNPAGAAALSDAAQYAGATIDVLIEIDSGLGRCGVPPAAAADLAAALLRRPGLRLSGVFTHAGHAYRARDGAELSRIAQQEADAVRYAAGQLRAMGVACPVVSVGSTPTFLTPVDRTGITEARPGNYALLDRTQVALGVANLDQCAFSVICTVVSTGPGRAVVDGGSKVFGLDQGAHGVSLLDGYGEDPERGAMLSWLSEEHGVVADPAGRFEVGDRLRFVPNHACATANLAGHLYLVDGETVVDDVPVDAPGGGR
ncbi:alanine racemase [Micromonospora sp. NBC_01813]|uniref:alanine racemase n=1 Tax=Micromonospora sp. NBC_01813 TaxID=2975988 RepID=UPI002DDB8957|nr:alanine racemase [Micromonospora sp. NBC_01813]WSA10052.1 alanine racemase [Micromonospora sp. NBC_01813]